MNTFRFLELLSADLVTDDWASIANRDKLQIVNKINRAILDHNAIANANTRTRDINILITAPRSLNVTTTAGSTSLGSVGLTVADSSKSIVLANDPFWHRLSINGLELRAPAANSGSTTAMLYSDAAALPAGFTDLYGELVITKSEWTIPLKPLDQSQLTEVQLQRPWDQMGLPTYYSLENVTAQTADIATGLNTILRLFPVPREQWRITGKCYVSAKPWTLADFTTARTLELPDEHWIMLHEIVLMHLIPTGLLHPSKDLDLLAAAGERAKDDLKDIRGPHIRTRIAIPEGW